MNTEYDFWFWLAVMANFAQLQSYDILLHDFNNNDLIEYLKHQDNLLDKIINQNEEIIQLLKEGSNNGYRGNHTKNS